VVHLHGHVHGTLPDAPGSMDCGVERLDYRPIDVEDVSERIMPWIEHNAYGDRE
jgi:calcineurin-like phosphoesterase family protein